MSTSAHVPPRALQLAEGMSITQGTSERGTWVGPLIASVVTVPAALFAYIIGSLTPMACDSCNGAEAAHFDRSFDTAFTLLQIGLLTSLVLLLVSWSLPQTEENVARRAVSAVLAPSIVAFSFLLFIGMVPSPN
ncbi:hypothetical protein [Streptomyces sp. N50]|uniref:hypothetical protein n=1 Tax=Streptomyces sp. N50 TaxID=3081765 RepID=UPI0029625531|nr:hypothetical protein [Streptomyces sp. N50]WOX11848.1 hypothetical protein R2B38_24780 [Streptomyces sp. N50]